MLFSRGKHRYYFIRILVLLLSLALVGTIGFMWIEGWGFEDALYMVIITISTIGYQEIHELSDAGRAFNILFIFFGLGIAGYSLSFLSTYILEGHLKNYLTQKYMQKKISKLENHYIICGFGNIGRQIAYEFHKSKIPFVIVDSNASIREECELDNYLFLQGDASDENVLKMADVEHAKGLVSVVHSDADNVFIVLTSRSINPDLYIIARANDASSIPKLHQAGANKISISHRVSGYHLASMALHPAVVDFLDLITHGQKDGGYYIEEVLVSEGSKAVGKKASDFFSRDKHKVSLLAIFRDGGSPIIHPAEETVVSAEDRIILMGKREDLSLAFDSIE